METVSADGLYATEYQLLEIYHKNRKSRWSTKPKHNRLYSSGIEALIRSPASAETDTFAEVANKLTGIVDSVPPVQDQVVADTDQTIQRLIEILKAHGDHLNEIIKKDEEFLRHLQSLFNYSLFENLASAFIRSMVPQSNQKEEYDDQKIRIAWTFEMTSRLSALDLQPMNRAMGFGAKYVHQHFSTWIQHHGGWENAF